MTLGRGELDRFGRGIQARAEGGKTGAWGTRKEKKGTTPIGREEKERREVGLEMGLGEKHKPNRKGKKRRGGTVLGRPAMERIGERESEKGERRMRALGRWASAWPEREKEKGTQGLLRRGSACGPRVPLVRVQTGLNDSWKNLGFGLSFPFPSSFA